MGARTIHGVGAGWRQELGADLLARRELVDFVEVIAETCFVQSRARREALAVAEVWPVVPHGVKLSLGSAAGLDDERARRLGELARALRAPMVTEHVALTSAGGREVGHLTQLPRTRHAVSVVARNVARARRHLPDVPLALENVAWTVRWPDDAMREEDFYAEVTRATGCPMLLDLGNLHANARNEGRDPLAVLRAFPLERVAAVHIAGGHAEDDFYHDDHASPVPAGVFELLDELVRLRGAVPVLLERDANFPPFEALAAELTRAREIVARGAQREVVEPVAATQGGDLGADPRGDDADLAARQEAFVRALTQGDAAPVGFDARGVARTREVLQRKRIDDAMPILTRLSGHGPRVAELARRAVDAHPRPRSGAAVHDAWRIAELAAEHPVLGPDARVDLLVLRARFEAVRAGEVPTARAMPFVGATTSREGRRVWAVKGIGRAASVRLVEREVGR